MLGMKLPRLVNSTAPVKAQKGLLLRKLVGMARFGPEVADPGARLATGIRSLMKKTAIAPIRPYERA